ncbi:MAG: trigger factor [Dehalococcoidia bacterium]|nr:trigger factor [Dehalococcoidia bacterium]
MKTTSEKIENCQIALNVEMEGSETEKYMGIALEHLARRVVLPGFRKGKAPATLVEQHIGKQAIMQEALEHLVPEAYEEALKNESILAIDQPKIELVQLDPIIFKAIVPTKPEVTPGNYRDIRMELGKKEICEDDVNQVIEQLQLQFGTLVPAERAIRFGDIVTIDIDGKRGEENILSRKDAAYEVSQGSKYPVPGFAEKIEGMSKDEEKSFEIDFSDDYEIKEIAGKKYSFNVKVNEIKEKSLPEINDDFAKNAGSENLADLREKIKQGLQARADDSLKKEFEHKLITALIEQSAIDFPPVLVEREVDHIVNEEARNFPDGVKGLENYLVNAKKNLEQHREDLKPAAADRVKAYLVTSKIAELEGIIVNDVEVDQSIEKMAGEDPGRADEVKAIFSQPRPRESLRDMMVINKAMDFLTKLVTGQDNNINTEVPDGKITT